MSTEEMRPRRIIVIELEALPSGEHDNDAATEGTSARIQQRHDLATKGVQAQAEDHGELTPAGIAPDAKRDREAEARIIEKGGARLQAILAERTKMAKGHVIESVGSAAAAVSELQEMRLELAIEFHVRAEYELGRAIDTILGFWDRCCPSNEEIVHDIIKDGVKWAILATVAFIGTQVVG